MRLFIAEKKVLAEAIAEALDGKAIVKDGVIYKEENVLVWCSGHLLTLREPESYDDKYKKWCIEDLPIYFDNWENAVPAENKNRVKQIGELIKQADEIVNCGDTDEEGQLLVDEILRWFNYKGPCKRLDTANTTVDALKKALTRMKDNRECEANGWSAYAREVADMTFGVNFTRFFSKSYNAKLPVGRVMTPTLGLVVNRDKAIEEHQKSYYYIMNVKSRVSGKDVQLKYIPDKKLENETADYADGKFISDNFLKMLAVEFNGKRGKYTVKKEKVVDNAPLPFNLTELNNYCGKKWGYNPDKVMKITQALRDDYAAITYNRSDCQYLSSEHHKEAPETILSVCNNLNIEDNTFDSTIVSRCFNDSNITAHFAIIPTNQQVDINKLSDEQLNVYNAICTFYLIQFMPACEKEKTTVTAPTPLINNKTVGKIEISASKIIKPGFRNLLMEEKEETEQNIAVTELPAGLFDGVILDTEILKKETKPPQRYTQTSLFDDMTKISKYVDDEEIKKLLLEKDKEKKGENGSIGTSATRAEIIKKLIHVGYLEEIKEKKKTVLISTDKGRKFYNLLPDNIKKADTTAKWWVIQENIKNGQETYQDLTEGVVKLICDIMKTFHANAEDAAEFSFQATTPICKCPACNGDILKGKFGPYCSNKCGFRMIYAFGKKLTEKQFISLCSGKKTKISGIKKKNGDGTFDAYANPAGIEDFQYKSANGGIVQGKQIKLTMSFK